MATAIGTSSSPTTSLNPIRRPLTTMVLLRGLDLRPHHQPQWLRPRPHRYTPLRRHRHRRRSLSMSLSLHLSLPLLRRQHLHIRHPSLRVVSPQSTRDILYLRMSILPIMLRASHHANHHASHERCKEICHGTCKEICRGTCKEIYRGTFHETCPKNHLSTGRSQHPYNISQSRSQPARLRIG